MRLRCSGGKKIKKELTVAGKDIKRTIGITTEIEVFKSSVDKPFRTAPLTILFDYGVDDVRQNLQYLKTYTAVTSYYLNDKLLGKSLEDAIQMVESAKLENELRDAVIDLWEDIEAKFDSRRKKKER